MAQKVRLLAFDTSSAACSVAVLDTTNRTDTNIHSLHNIMPMQQGRLILPMIQAILDKSSLTLHDLDAIAYGCGPGSFTGIRIASSVVQGLGMTLTCPIIQVSSLAAIAQAAYQEQQWRSVLVALDARMGDVYWAKYTANKEDRMSLEGVEEVVTPEKITIPSEGHDWYGVGDAWGRYGEILTNKLGFKPKSINLAQLPTAEAMLPIARMKLDQGDWVNVSDAIPVYLR